MAQIANVSDAFLRRGPSQLVVIFVENRCKDADEDQDEKGGHAQELYHSTKLLQSISLNRKKTYRYRMI